MVFRQELCPSFIKNSVNDLAVLICRDLPDLVAIGMISVRTAGKHTQVFCVSMIAYDIGDGKSVPPDDLSGFGKRYPIYPDNEAPLRVIAFLAIPAVPVFRKLRIEALPSDQISLFGSVL